MSNKKTAFVDKSRIEPTTFFIEKISFSLKLFSGHFYGQSFIKTVRGPLDGSPLSTILFCSILSEYLRQAECLSGKLEMARKETGIQVRFSAICIIF